MDAGASLLVHIPQRRVLAKEDTRRLAESGVPIVSTVRLLSASHELRESDVRRHASPNRTRKCARVLTRR